MICSLIILTSCTSKKENSYSSSAEKLSIPNPNMSAYYNGEKCSENGNYYYVIDENTGVVYISFDEI